MKKSYIQPKTMSIKIACQTIIAATLQGTGAKISNSDATKAAESRGGDLWDDDEE